MSDTNDEPSAAAARASRSVTGLVGDELRLDDHLHRVLKRLDLIHHRRDRTLREQDHPRRGNANQAPRRRNPLRHTPQHPGPQAEHTLVPAQLAVPDIERLILDQQPDDLAIRDAHHRLPILGITIPSLRTRQRPRLIQPSEIDPRQPKRLPLVEVRPHPHVPIGEREHQLCLHQEPKIKRSHVNRPPLNHKPRVLDHAS